MSLPVFCKHIWHNTLSSLRVFVCIREEEWKAVSGRKPTRRSRAALTAWFFCDRVCGSILCVCVFVFVSLPPVREQSKHIPKSLRLERGSGFDCAYRRQSSASKCFSPRQMDKQSHAQTEDLTSWLHFLGKLLEFYHMLFSSIYTHTTN